MLQNIISMAKRLYSKFKSSCQKTDTVLTDITKPVMSFKKLVVELGVIIAVIVFLFSPSVILLIPFLLNFGMGLVIKKTDQDL